MPQKKTARLTEAEWAEVFRLRCLSKQGKSTWEGIHPLCRRAYIEDSKRYSKMDLEVFEATKPFGAR